MIRFSQLLWLIPFISFATGYLFISSIYKNKILQAPALVGKNLDKALLLTSQQNLNIRIIGQKNDPELPEGTIITQTPAPGKAIKENQALYVTIAQKPIPLQIPDLRNKQISDAITLIENASLQAKMYPISCDTLNNQCIAQYPQEGMISLNNAVIVYTAQYTPKPIIMPNFKMKALDEVLEFLSLHNINPTIIHQHQETLHPRHECSGCVIIDQRPLPGSIVVVSGNAAVPIQLQVSTV